MRIKLLTLLALFFASMAVAQNNVKIGYTNIEHILAFMPEAKEIDAELQEYEKQLMSRLEAKYQDFQTKAADFQQNGPNMIPEVRNDKQQELATMQQDIEKFQREAQMSLQKRQAEKLEPVYTKIQEAIDAVAKENGFTHVFSSDQGGVFVLLYARDEDNITDLVFKKLGVEPPKAEEPAAAGN